ncbi:MAG: DUF4012 domain-containing protein [Actinomycetota bacterium]
MILLILLGLLAWIALALVSAAGASRDLLAARTAMYRGREALLVGNADEAMRQFQGAVEAVTRARQDLRSPFVRAFGFLPLIGRSPDTTVALAEAGDRAARAGVVLATAVQDLPGGPSALAPRNGRIALKPLRSVAPSLGEADALLREADEIMRGSPSSLLIPPLGQAREEFLGKIDGDARVLTSAAALTRQLPQFLGSGKPRHYFVGAQNPAELRGTGGLIGSYAILTVRGGRLELGPFSPTTDLKRAPISDVEPPNEDYARNYDRFQARGSWSNINLTPDFPSAAVAIERLWEQVAGESARPRREAPSVPPPRGTRRGPAAQPIEPPPRLDGVILTDPEALASLLRVTGAVPGPSGQTIDPRNVVAYVTNQAYAELPGSRARKELLGDVAQAVFDRFIEGRAADDPVRAGRLLIEAAADGHFLFHATDPDVQAAFATAGIAGPLPGPSGDFLAVVANNAAGNKIDYYLEQAIRYRVTLGAEGSASGTATVRLANTAPKRGMPAYVIGPHSSRFKAGENVSLIRTYCASTCLLESFRGDRGSDAVGSGLELDHPVYESSVNIPSAQEEILEYTWRVARAWEGGSGSGAYHLTVRGQPTITPTTVELDIRIPDGMEVVSVTPGMRVGEGRVLWSGPLTDVTTFEVRFQRPPLQRAWHSVLDFLRRPVLGFGSSVRQ